MAVILSFYASYNAILSLCCEMYFATDVFKYVNVTLFSVMFTQYSTMLVTQYSTMLVTVSEIYNWCKPAFFL